MTRYARPSRDMMSGLRILLATLVPVVVAACDGTFKLTHVPEIDAALDAPLGPCIDDDFESGMIDTGVWLEVGGTSGVVVDVQGGHAVFAVPAATSASQDPYGGLGDNRRDLTGAVAQVEILQVSSATAPSEVVLQLKVDGANSYSMLVQKQRLVTRKFVDNVETNDSVAYSSEQHRFIRMRDDTATGQMVYEARSVDGPWTEISHTTADVSLIAANLSVFAGSYDVAPAFIASIDNVQLLGPCTF